MLFITRYSHRCSVIAAERCSERVQPPRDLLWCLYMLAERIVGVIPMNQPPHMWPPLRLRHSAVTIRAQLRIGLRSSAGRKETQRWDSTRRWLACSSCLLAVVMFFPSRGQELIPPPHPTPHPKGPAFPQEPAAAASDCCKQGSHLPSQPLPARH